jgi:uncharacterized surface protein with fasciclin (FAS1) repeats
MVTNAQGDSIGAFPTVWTAGETVDVSYNIEATHGGGHQYRLCPAGNLFGDNSLDEECFQANVMAFADGKSTFVGGSGDDAVSIEYDALDVDDSNTDGVWPSGTTWRKLGLPPCLGLSGTDDCSTPQFTENMAPGYWGYPAFDVGSPDLQAIGLHDWKIIDKVVVPEGLNGDYVVSWRWDSEQTPQVWTQCAIVTIQDPAQMLGDGNMTATESDGECESLIDVVCGSESFTLFCEALKAADLDSAFDEESWTFFIPNDEAFESIQSILEALSDEQITNILLFHALEGQVVMSKDLECKEELTMFNGVNSRTKCKNGVVYQNGFGNNQLLFSPQIIQTDIEFCNGVAHVIDGVMLPKDFGE